MKFLIVLALVAAVATAVPVDSKTAEIVSYESDNIGLDNYKYRAETSDGKTVEEVGVLKNVGTDKEAMEVRGFFSYYGPDGVFYNVKYVADENGFQPSGDHLPVAPQQ